MAAVDYLPQHHPETAWQVICPRHRSRAEAEPRHIGAGPLEDLLSLRPCPVPFHRVRTALANAAFHVSGLTQSGGSRCRSVLGAIERRFGRLIRSEMRRARRATEKGTVRPKHAVAAGLSLAANRRFAPAGSCQPAETPVVRPPMGGVTLFTSVGFE